MQEEKTLEAIRTLRAAARTMQAAASGAPGQPDIDERRAQELMLAIVKLTLVGLEVLEDAGFTDPNDAVGNAIDFLDDVASEVLR